MGLQSIAALEKEIKSKKCYLNKIVEQGLDKDEVIQFSQELDLMIVAYYKLKLNK